MSRSSSQLKSRIVKAGAGTGKTTRLIEEVFKKIKQDLTLNPEREPRLMVCTFTKKATQELKERLIEKSLEFNDPKYIKFINSSSLHISTIHGILTSFLQAYGSKYDLNFDFDLISKYEENKIIHKILSRFIYKEDYIHILKKLSYTNITEILKFYTKQKLLFPDAQFMNEKSFKELNQPGDEDNFLDLFNKMQKLADEFHECFLNDKKKLNVLTYDDLELFSLDLIRNKPQVAKSFSSEWDYWFIDEYQDTSLIQEMIFQKLTDFKNVFCVGDPQQSIYSFRGADPDVFQRRFTDSKMEKETLDINYRSHFSLISFFNDFFKEEQNILKLQAKDNTKSSYPSIYLFEYDKEEEDADENCFKMIAYHIEQLHQRGAQYSDICILSQKNNHLSSLALYLKNKKFTVYIKSKEGFYNRRVVLDALFAIRFLINPHDKENLLALLRTPYFYISDKELSDFCKDYRDHFINKQNDDPQAKDDSSFWNHIKEYDYFPIKKLKEYLDLKTKEGLINSFEKIIFSRGFMDIISYQDPSGVSESYLWKFLSLVRKTEKINNHSLLDLFYKITKDELNDEQSKEVDSFLDSDSINLMTIHQSKGLQFKHVLIFDLSKKASSSNDIVALDPETKNIVFSAPPKDDLFGDKMKCSVHKKLEKEKKSQNEEELKRLMYVAMTRSEETLTFFLPDLRSKDPKSKAKTSRFTGSLFRGFSNFFENSIASSDYIVQIKTEIDKEPSLEQKSVEVHELHPLVDKVTSKTLPIKSAQHYLKSEDLQNQKKEDPFILNHFKNIFFKSYLGNQMHDTLELLTKHPFSVVEAKVNSMHLKEKEKLIEALEYLSQIKDPDLRHFFKEGYSEWPFQLKTKQAILKGRIDLWGHKGNEIWIFDYKSSSLKKQKNIFKQLAFYAYVLEEIYQPEKITMCIVYPMAQTLEKQMYSESHKKQLISWLESTHQNSI